MFCVINETWLLFVSNLQPGLLLSVSSQAWHASWLKNTITPRTQMQHQQIGLRQHDEKVDNYYSTNFMDIQISLCIIPKGITFHDGINRPLLAILLIYEDNCLNTSQWVFRSTHYWWMNSFSWKLAFWNKYAPGKNILKSKAVFGKITLIME